MHQTGLTSAVNMPRRHGMADSPEARAAFRRALDPKEDKMEIEWAYCPSCKGRRLPHGLICPEALEDPMQHLTEVERLACAKPECADPDPEQVKALEQALADEEARLRKKMANTGVSKPAQKGRARTQLPSWASRRKALAKRQKHSNR